MDAEIRSIEDRLETLMYHLRDAHIAENEEDLVSDAEMALRPVPEGIEVGVVFEGLLYLEHPTTRALIAERAADGRVQRALVSDDDGSLGDWHDAPIRNNPEEG